ncbi:MAG: aquaporin [Candidatus Saccharimonadales bacterium]
MFGRAKLAAVTAEFLGTGLLTLAVLTAATRGAIPAAFAAGLTLAVGVLIFGKVSGAHFNPAITLGFWTAGKVKTLKAIAYVAVQVLGAYAAFKLFEYLTGNPLNTGSGEFSGRGLTAEAIGTFVLALAVAVAVYRKYTSAQAAATIGGGIALGVVVASAGSIGFINPAIGLSVLGFDSWVWGIYVVGPIVGAIVGVNLYALLFDDERVAFKAAVAKEKAAKAAAAATATKAETKKEVKKPATTKKSAAQRTAKKAAAKKK